MMIRVLPSGVLRSVQDCGVAKWKFSALFRGKRFYGPPPCLFDTNLKYFRFSGLFFSCVVSKNVLTLFQNLAMVMRQRNSTLMAKPADFSRLDKDLWESLGLPRLSLIQTSFIMITILW